MKTFIATATGLLVATGFAATAQAGGMVDKSKTEAKADTQVVQTIDADGQVGQLTIFEVDTNDRTTAVLGAFEQQNTDAYIVADNEGDLYINHLIPISELPDPYLDVDTEETYTIEYKGMTFTNRIVEQD
ncbi:hypothetical protein ACFFUB_06680 [Algimonas porphyrae]|uniref:PRC-barrel domain-containing protein n=1 Tax=Algimonas porphyrae TaxID=1128113 RepID=A0ABQ5V2G4_9PROT|nr:hypothetical protein [Algimonas porphyrae]GLQ21152.1 hypothetical protein GCM10007854_21070 [Algimonas porphyrae]